jgi:hypothetical protein
MSDKLRCYLRHRVWNLCHLQIDLDGGGTVVLEHDTGDGHRALRSGVELDDGSGRRFMTHLATTTDRGSLARPDSTAAATRTQGLTANRLANATAAEYGYYRNRLYDQRTGRWTRSAWPAASISISSMAIIR